MQVWLSGFLMILCFFMERRRKIGSYNMKEFVSYHNIIRYSRNSTYGVSRKPFRSGLFRTNDKFCKTAQSSKLKIHRVQIVFRT